MTAKTVSDPKLQGEWLGAIYAPAHALALSTSVIIDGWAMMGHEPTNVLEKPPLHQNNGPYGY